MRMTWATRKMPALVLGLALAALGVQGAWAQGIPGTDKNACLAGKTKCVNAKIAGLLACRSKCQKNPAKCGAVQEACEAKVKAKFDGGANPAKGCFAKLEAKSVPGAKPEK